MTGEGYAGKYIPRFSWDLYQKGGFSLHAALIGDPFTAPLTQRRHMHILPEALNILDDSNLPQIATLNKNCIYSSERPELASDCAAVMDYIEKVSGNVFAFDQRIAGEDWDPIEDPVTNYFTKQSDDTLNEIFTKIHVNVTTIKMPTFTMHS